MKTNPHIPVAANQVESDEGWVVNLYRLVTLSGTRDFRACGSRGG